MRQVVTTLAASCRRQDGIPLGIVTPDLPTDSEPTEDHQPNERLILALAGALLHSGTPAHRLENVLGAVATSRGLHGTFFVVPTAVIAAFGPPGQQRSALVRSDPGWPDLGSVARLDEVVKEILDDRIPPGRARQIVADIDNRPPSWPGWSVLLCFGLSSAATAVFFGAGWAEIGIAGAVGLGLGLLEQLMRASGARFVFVPLAAGIGSFIAYAGQGIFGAYNPEVVTLAGLLYLLPGLTLTTALTELSGRHLASGTARLTFAALILFELAFGVGMGSSLGSRLVPSLAPIAHPVPGFVEPIALILVAVSFLGLFHARLKDALVIIASCTLAFYAARVGATLIGPQLGAAVGALLVALFCNGYARLFDRPPTVPLVPGILLLVPGSVGLRSMTRLLAHETVPAVDAAFEMTLIAISLAVGLLTANAILPPKRGL